MVARTATGFSSGFDSESRLTNNRAMNPPFSAVDLEPPSRRELRKARTHRQLLDAARRLFVKLGYDATRPQDIARAAGVATGTFYLHFEDKRDAFLAFTDEAAHELMERVRARTSAVQSFAERLLLSLEVITEYSERHPGVLAAAFAEASVIAAGAPESASLRDRLAQSLAQALREGMSRGELRSDYDPTLIAHAIVGLAQQGLRFGTQGRVERRMLLETLVRFCARALVTENDVEHEEVTR